MGNEERDASPSAERQIEFDLALLGAFGGIVKWLLASLLLLNGGALIALLQHDQASILIAASGPYFIKGATLPVIGAAMAAVFVGANIDLRKVFPEANEGKQDDKVRKVRAGNRAIGVFALFVALGCMMGSILVFATGASAVGEALSQLSQTERANAPVLRQP